MVSKLPKLVPKLPKTVSKPTKIIPTQNCCEDGAILKMGKNGYADILSCCIKYFCKKGFRKIVIFGLDFNYASTNKDEEFETANKATLNKIVSKSGNIIDETITTFFKSPKSFTGEDVIEISVHGSSAVLNKILLVLGDFSTCRIAEPGEFSRRAFENNKLDLAQIEALADLINSETEAKRQQAIKQLGGALSKKMNIISEKILKVLADVEAIIDFVDEDLPNNIIHKSK